MNYMYNKIYQHLQRGAKFFFHHPFGSNWHRFEGAGTICSDAGDVA